jgi:hypothetical protein
VSAVLFNLIGFAVGVSAAEIFISNYAGFMDDDNLDEWELGASVGLSAAGYVSPE